MQTDPFYKDNTTLIITTDHGRGKNAATWHKHGLFTKGSGDAWLAMMEPHISPQGEMKSEQQLYQKQIAQTVASILGFEFKADHKVSKEINFPTNTINEKAVKNVDIKSSLILSMQK